MRPEYAKKDSSLAYLLHASSWMRGREFKWTREVRRTPFKPSAMGGRERRASLWNPVKSALIKDLKVVKGVFSRIAQNARI